MMKRRCLSKGGLIFVHQILIRNLWNKLCVGAIKNYAIRKECKLKRMLPRCASHTKQKFELLKTNLEKIGSSWRKQSLLQKAQWRSQASGFVNSNTQLQLHNLWQRMNFSAQSGRELPAITESGLNVIRRKSGYIVDDCKRCHSPKARLQTKRSGRMLSGEYFKRVLQGVGTTLVHCWCGTTDASNGNEQIEHKAGKWTFFRRILPSLSNRAVYQTKDCQIKLSKLSVRLSIFKSRRL